ncbi:hypothetical protein D1007_56382 [Hordeum vulgare]|nr:hypothetical protein D1007_56382 [Hordeum vulgare]
MGIFSRVGSISDKNKGKVPAVSWRVLPQLSSTRLPRQQISVPLHRARWHWEHRFPLPYPDVILPQAYHLYPNMILVRAVPQLAHAHAMEVRHRQQQLMPKQRLNLTYAAHSPDWEVWFAFEHEDQRRCGIRDMRAGTPPPLVIRDEDQEVLAGVLR